LVMHSNIDSYRKQSDKSMSVMGELSHPTLHGA